MFFISKHTLAGSAWWGGSIISTLPRAYLLDSEFFNALHTELVGGWAAENVLFQLSLLRWRFVTTVCCLLI